MRGKCSRMNALWRGVRIINQSAIYSWQKAQPSISSHITRPHPFPIRYSKDSIDDLPGHPFTLSHSGNIHSGPPTIPTYSFTFHISHFPEMFNQDPSSYIGSPDDPNGLLLRFHSFTKSHDDLLSSVYS
jgi:hypothetical protein